MKLQELHTQALQIMENLNLAKNIDGYTVQTFKSKTCFGNVKYLQKIININEVVLQYEEEKALNTLIHELLHAYCYENFKETGHTGKWKSLANYISNNTDYVIKRTDSTSQFCEEVQANFATRASDYKYAIICAECGATTRRKKKTEIIKLLEENKPHLYQCGRCGCKKLKLEML